jgi:hypothetical protein
MPHLLPLIGINIQASLGAAIIGGAITGGLVSGAGQVVTNLLMGEEWHTGLGRAVLTGIFIGGIAGGIGYTLRSLRSAPPKSPSSSGQDAARIPLSTAEKRTLWNQARQAFYKANPRFQKFIGTFKMEIHHRIPLQWTHLFQSSDPNRLSNLYALSRSVHRTVVTPAWNAFASGNPNASASDVLRFAMDMDKVIGWLINRIP